MNTVTYYEFNNISVLKLLITTKEIRQTTQKDMDCAQGGGEEEHE